MPPLIEMKKGQTAKITGIEGSKGVHHKLSTMGLRVGKELKIVALQPFKGPVVLEIDGRQFALGRGLASKIAVEVNA